MGKLSSLEIKRQQFKKVMRGYDPEEVDVFLEMLSEKFEDLGAANDDLNTKLVKLETKLDDYQKNEKNINEILSRTREMQEEASQNLKKQEEIILKDAEFKAVEILENARKEARQIREEVLDLQHKKESFVSRLKYLIHSYMDLLKMLEAENMVDESELEKGVPKSGKTSNLLRNRRKVNKKDTSMNQTAEEKSDRESEKQQSGDDKPGSEEWIGDETSEKKDPELDNEIFVHDISNLIDKIDNEDYDDNVEDKKKKEPTPDK